MVSNGGSTLQTPNKPWSQMGMKPIEETNTKMEEKEMVWCKDKRQEKDLYKLWNRHNGVHPSIDKI